MGGPAGLTASIASARNGVDTILIEQYGCLGGTSTVGLLSLWGPFDNGEKRIIKGIPEEILNRLIDAGGAFDERKKSPLVSSELLKKSNLRGFTPINPEVLKYVADEMIREAGVKILFHSFAFDVIMSEEKIVGVMIANKSGVSKIYADVIIDATGDGDIAARSGVPYQKGDEKLGLLNQ